MYPSVHGLHTLPNPMNSSVGTHIPEMPRRRKHPNSGVAAALRRKGGIPVTPLFQRKLHKKHSGNSSPVNFKHGFPKRELSARKLAAGLWQLRFMEVSGDGGAAFGDGSFHSSKPELANGNVRIMFPPYHNSGEKFIETKDLLLRPVTNLRSVNGIRCELESFQPRLKCSKEEAAKWDPTLSEASNGLSTKIHGRKLLEDRKLVGDSVVTALLAELLRAQRSINRLKVAQKFSKKKVEQFVQKLEEEKVIWKHREHQKIQTMLDDLKDKLARERRCRERMELLNTKLVHELAEANLSAKQFMTNYEEEKKRREVIEEVCNELAMQIGQDKVKLEVLLRDSMKIREEVEEERKMLQMAEQWREERVQMKLVDAKLALEDKYNQMIQLIAYLQTFLISKGAELGTMEGDAQLIKEAAESVNIQRIVELLHDFSKSDNIFSMYEKLRKDNANERVIKPDSHPSITGPLSTIHSLSLDEEGLNKNSVLHQSRPTSDYNIGLEVTNSCETVSHVEDQNFNSPPQRGDTYLDNVNQNKNTLGGEAECSEKADQESPKTGVIGVCPASAGQSKWKASSASKLLRSCPSEGTTSSSAKISRHKKPIDGGYKHHNSVAQQKTADLTFDECSRGSIQSGGITSTSPCKGSGEGGFRHWELWGQRNSTDTMNPHITRGMKGCIEWPRGIPKTNSKAIPLEERVRSQKSQLQHILKPKA